MNTNLTMDQLQALKPITAGNEFFDPDKCDCEVLGFFEEYVREDAGSGYGYSYLGCRTFTALPTRPVGEKGRISVVLTEPIHLNKGHKKVLVRASKKRPIPCYAMIQLLCGKSKEMKGK
jgi:hypothetical protein